MTAHPVDVIARTLLYEGYVLYPYRPSSVKNQQRFNFGVLYPEAFCAAGLPGTDRSELQMQVPAHGNGDMRLAVAVRFLQIVDRQADDLPTAWQQAVEREVVVPGADLDSLRRNPTRVVFNHSDIRGEVQLGCEEMSPGAWKLTVRVSNLTALDSASASRDATLRRSLVSAHVVVRADGGSLISLLDPPEAFRALAASCSNVGVWPVLVGEEGTHDRMLASPIILYDYPQVAPESAGDLFDSTEIDEILALRILTLTDDEKREARGADDRVRQILDRTESLPPEHWAKLHGAVRGLRRVTEGSS